MIPKFRAWHKELKRMYSVLSMEQIHTTHMRIYSAQGDVFSINEIELMQWSGLQDKSGNYIYENDFIRIDFSDYYSICKVFFDKDFLSWRVEFTDGNRMDLIEYAEDDYIEALIVGNIYSNPELLEIK